MNKLLNATALATVLTVGAFGLATQAHATTMPITTVPSGGTIVNGNMTFTFGSNACSITGGNGALTCAGITASAYTSSTPPDGVAGLPGITFQATFNSGSPGTEDVALEYAATISSGLFDDVQLTFNGNSLPNGMVATNINEEVFITGTDTVIGDVSVNSPGDLTTDIALTQDVASITVIKDIELLSDSSTDPATISFVNQTFSTVPEPASLAIFGVSLIGLGVIRRRRRSKQA